MPPLQYCFRSPRDLGRNRPKTFELLGKSLPQILRHSEVGGGGPGPQNLQKTPSSTLEYKEVSVNRNVPQKHRL
jgi:hypothetical protein